MRTRCLKGTIKGEKYEKSEWNETSEGRGE
mgnify:CR=1 FL=1